MDEVAGVEVGEDGEDLAENAFLFRLRVRGRGSRDEREGSVIYEEGVEGGIVKVGDHVDAPSSSPSENAVYGKNVGVMECLKNYFSTVVLRYCSVRSFHGN